MTGRKPTAQAPADGLAAVFDAIEALTYREMNQLAALLQMQADELAPTASQEEFAQMLINASESYAEAGDEAE